MTEAERMIEEHKTTIRRKIGLLHALIQLRRSPDLMLPALKLAAKGCPEIHPLLERAVDDNAAVQQLLAWVERGGRPLH